MRFHYAVLYTFMCEYKLPTKSLRIFKISGQEGRAGTEQSFAAYPLEGITKMEAQTVKDIIIYQQIAKQSENVEEETSRGFSLDVGLGASEGVGGRLSRGIVEGSESAAVFLSL